MLKLPSAEMDKDGLSLDDLTVLMTQLWCRDFYEYRGQPTDRTPILLYCFTSARTGEVHESTARRARARESPEEESDEALEARVMAAYYKELLIHGFYEIYKNSVPLFFNLLTFSLPLASADRAFRDYSSIEEILNVTEAYGVNCSENQILEVIYFADSVRDVPLFRQFGELQIDKYTGKARGAGAFRKEFANLGHCGGYTRNVTVHQKHSEAARIKFTDRRTTSELLVGVSISKIITAWDYIIIHNFSIKAKFKFQDRKNIRDLDLAIRSLGLQLLDTEDNVLKPELQLQQRRSLTERDRL
ncbi:hypothetical protein N7530_003958 [Penicillium desertorum]|uniref:Uncharacterized protein n=1 Tax=Penicillium desertorum TaxID=1303715 RepID=A0A9W9WX86_9EURO|nr:hypothetical protein N7530_003958 [Penicillium desertorum]